MRSILLTLLIILFANTLGINKTKDKNMKSLDKNLVKIVKQLELSGEQSQIDGMVYSTQDTIDGIVYSIQLISGNYVNILSQKEGSPYKNHNTYYLSNYHLRSETTLFYNISFGIAKRYDENGKLKEETDMDKIYGPRTFSFEDLIKKIKDKCEIDLLDNSRNNGVSVNWNSEQKQYIVTKFISYTRFRDITVDGQTGAIISDETKMRTRH